MARADEEGTETNADLKHPRAAAVADQAPANDAQQHIAARFPSGVPP